MNEIEIPSEVYVIGEEENHIETHILVKRAKQRFAEDYGYDYGDLKGTNLTRIPAYGMCVYVCYEPSLHNNLKEQADL